MPNYPDLHQMGRAAGNDEDRETPKYPIERDIFSLAHEIHQGERDGKIGQGDQGIGQYMKGEDATVPKVTVAMRHEPVGGEDFVEYGHQ